MDIRVLRYFLTVAREESFSRAAEVLFISQPTLSRQIRDMEEELGAQLLIRTNRNVRLTQEGMRLRRRAQEIVDLMDKTRDEFARQEEALAGDIYIGCGETQSMREIARIAIPLQKEHPGIHFHLYSGNAVDILEKLDQGLLDFGLVFEPFDTRKYAHMPLPCADTFGVLMRADHPLARRAAVTWADLKGIPMLIPSQGHSLSADPPGSTVVPEIGLNVVCTYNLLFNAAVLVEQGMGCALCLDHLADTTEHTGLTFRPLTPPLEIRLHLAWKRYQIFSPASQLFLNQLQAAFREDPAE